MEILLLKFNTIKANSITHTWYTTVYKNEQRNMQFFFCGEGWKLKGKLLNGILAFEWPFYMIRSTANHIAHLTDVITDCYTHLIVFAPASITQQPELYRLKKLNRSDNSCFNWIIRCAQHGLTYQQRINMEWDGIYYKYFSWLNFYALALCKWYKFVCDW